MKKLKYTKKADLIAKITLILGSAFMVGYFVVEALYALDYIKTGAIRIISLALVFIPGFVIFIYPWLFDDEIEDFSPKIKPYKFAVDLSSFEEFFNKTETSLEGNGLTKIAKQEYENYEFYLYATPRKITSVDFVLIINADEVTNEILEHSSEAYAERVESYYGKKFKNVSSNINVITTVCVNRITPALRSILSGNAGLDQDFSIGRFISAVSFGGKNLYMVKQKGLVGKMKYKKCKNKFKNYFAFLFPLEIDK